jgi:hypothetical protein
LKERGGGIRCVRGSCCSRPVAIYGVSRTAPDRPDWPPVGMLHFADEVILEAVRGQLGAGLSTPPSDRPKVLSSSSRGLEL